MDPLQRHFRWYPGGKLIHPPRPIPVPGAFHFTWEPLNYFRSQGETVRITTPSMNYGKTFATPAKRVVINYYLLMVELPMGGGSRPHQQWRLFEPGVKFDQVRFKDTFFADGYTYPTVAYLYEGLEYVPMIFSNRTAYPAWTGSGRDAFNTDLTMSFQYRMDSSKAVEVARWSQICGGR